MNVLSRRKKVFQIDEENPYWMSFSDIMAGLLVIFVLAAVALIVELTQKSQEWDKQIEEIAKAEEVRRNLLYEVEQELKAQNIPVKVSDNDTVLRIPDDVLSFKQGSFDIPSEKHQKVVLAIGEVLHAAIIKEERWKFLDTIFVEGHTDKISYRDKRIKGNWGLSTFRAISVWDFWNEKMEEGRRLEDIYNHDGNRLFSVSGYAETRPDKDTEADPDSEESLRKNRRIDIRITVRRPALEDYKQIKARLN